MAPPLPLTTRLSTRLDLVIVVVPWLSRPPPEWAKLPLTVQPVSVVVQPAWSYTPPPTVPAELPLMVQPVSVVVPPYMVLAPPPLREAELPLMVQLVSVVRALKLNRPPPS